MQCSNDNTSVAAKPSTRFALELAYCLDYTSLSCTLYLGQLDFRFQLVNECVHPITISPSSGQSSLSSPKQFHRMFKAQRHPPIRSTATRLTSSPTTSTCYVWVFLLEIWKKRNTIMNHVQQKSRMYLTLCRERKKGKNVPMFPASPGSLNCWCPVNVSNYHITMGCWFKGDFLFSY